MYILIVGGGKIGYYLAKTLLPSGHRIGLVERDERRCRAIAEDLDVAVINGEGTDIDTLRDAGADEAQFVAALTGRDEENLVICQIARSHFGTPQTIALVNNPKNQAIFKALGVDATVSSTALAAQMVENVLPLGGMRIFSVFQEGDVEITEAELSDGMPVTGMAVAQLHLPDECVLIALIHEGRTSFPRGRTILRAGDRVFALVRKKSIDEFRRTFLGGG